MSDIAVARPDIEFLARAWLDQADVPLAIVDQDLRLYWTNAAADIELDGRRAIEKRDNILTTVELAFQERLRQFARAAGRLLSTWSFPADGGFMLLRGNEIYRDNLNRYIGLRFFRTSNFTPVYADLDQAFDLTAREHLILRALMDSQRPDEIARELGLRLPTIRAHIRNLYDKLEVTCREELFRRVSPFRVV